MPGRDRLDELDQKIAASIRTAAEELRQSLEGGLEGVREQVRELILETEAADLSDLLNATLEIAHAGSEEDVVKTLVTEATRFAERSVFFRVDTRGCLSWAAAGFDNSTHGLLASDDPHTGPWQYVSKVQRAVRLSAEECGEILSGLEVVPASRGALVPMALGGRIVGALYADVTSSATVDLPGLQLLTHSAVRALETLSLDGLGAPPALERVDEVAASNLPLWNPTGDVEAQPES